MFRRVQNSPYSSDFKHKFEVYTEDINLPNGTLNVPRMQKMDSQISKFLRLGAGEYGGFRGEFRA